MMDTIRVLFMLPEHCANQSQASEIMLQAFEACKQNVINVSWIKEEEFGTVDFSKTDFVIFQEFKGKHFEALSESKCARILGPWCVFICLMEGKPIPNFTWPIYNVAMAGCVVSCSHLPKAKKIEIKEKVKLMGGCYTDNLMSTNTHLITDSVKSEKYLQAAESGVKLMISQWINAVWEASQSKNIHCNHEEFNKYKCLPFHNLTVSSTGIPDVQMRNELGRLVAKNGGVFTANLSLTNTDVLVVYGVKGTLSQKYKAASKNSNTNCVTIEWIHDSIEKGYALPHNLYQVIKGKTSTPTKIDETCPNFSIISAIGDCDRQRTTLEETIARNIQPFLTPKRISPQKRKCPNSQEIGQLIDGLDIKKVKKAGQYLDSCSVYVAGFRPEQREKLCKILNLSGATRYDDISDRLTHIIVGDPSCPEMKIIKSKNFPVSLVSVHWLLDSLDKQQALDEEAYLINLHDSEKEQFSSPLSQKGLSLLRSNKTLTSNDLKHDSPKVQQEPELDNDLVLQYRKTANKDNESDTLMQLLNADSKFTTNPESSQTAKEPPTDDDSFAQRSELGDKSSQPNNVFYSKKFLITSLDPEDSQYIKEQIESVFGTVMSKSYKGIPDYVVAPLFVTTPIQISALEVVNKLWILECIQECEEQPISYYHQPLVIVDKKPLDGCVVTISGYTTYERIFFKELIEALGGMSQEQFARIKSVEKGVYASTHLISLTADGKKYKAALKWGLPVVNKEWLFECARTGKMAPEEDFLMGEAKPPSRSSSSSDSSNKISRTPSVQEKSNRILTPQNQKTPLDINKIEQTPVNKRLFDRVGRSPGVCSQVTPVNKLMEEVRRTNLLGTPQTPPLPKSWYLVETPDSPFGAAIKPHMSPKSKKELLRYIECIPDFVPPPKEKKSTPLSEIKRRFWERLGQNGGSPSQFPENRTEPSTSKVCEEYREEEPKNEVNEDLSEANTENLFLATKFQQIHDMASAMGENRRSSKAFHSTIPQEVANSDAKDTQPLTVCWDYNDDIGRKPQMRIFILSGVENELRQSIVAQIESLGGQVSELSSYDPKCTHLICTKPARNEKALACMAAGKWILHTSYVEKSVAAGKFLDEESFEFGNPKSKENIKIHFDKETEHRLQSMHWWRKEIAKRGYGAFNDMRAIVVAQKREPLVRVIEAGGGQVVDAEPPFKDNIHATHCLLEARSVPDISVFIPLAQQGILCINTLYISEFLYKTNKDIKEAILPHFSSYY